MYRTGRRRASGRFVVFFAPNGLDHSRFGISAGRALGGAVARNRIRRRVREILRQRRQEISSGWDIILHPRGSVATSEWRTLAEELLGLLRSALQASVTPSVRHDLQSAPE